MAGLRYAQLIQEWLDAIDGDFVAALEAQKLVASVREKEPEALSEWLDWCAVDFTRIEMAVAARKERSAARGRPISTAIQQWKDAAEASERGEAEAFSPFQIRYVVSDDNTRRLVGEMTGPDHAYVADQYATTGKRALGLEAFHRAVAKKIKTKRTADVMSEEQYELLYQSIVTG